MGTVTERPNHDLKCGTFSLTTHPLGRGEGLEIELKINHAYLKKPP
jgi:hypothetical protein